jgi:hypothetical protein
MFTPAMPVGVSIMTCGMEVKCLGIAAILVEMGMNWQSNTKIVLVIASVPTTSHQSLRWATHSWVMLLAQPQGRLTRFHADASRSERYRMAFALGVPGKGATMTVLQEKNPTI